MDRTYCDTVTRLEHGGIDPEYILGWQSGYLHNPPREEQRVSAAYSAGYADGFKGTTENSTAWVTQ